MGTPPSGRGLSGGCQHNQTMAVFVQNCQEPQLNATTLMLLKSGILGHVGSEPFVIVNSPGQSHLTAPILPATKWACLPSFVLAP